MAQNYQVISQRQREILGPNENFIPVMNVVYMTSHGDRGEVDIPVAMFTVDAVKEAIESQVQHMLAVRDL